MCLSSHGAFGSITLSDNPGLIFIIILYRDSAFILHLSVMLSCKMLSRVITYTAHSLQSTILLAQPGDLDLTLKACKSINLVQKIKYFKRN